MGICQIQHRAAKQVGFKGTEKDLMDPKVNIEAAAKYLVYKKKRYGNWHQALVSYNRGHSTGKTKTNSYFRKVMTHWSKYPSFDVRRKHE